MKFLHTVILMQIALLVLMSCHQKKKGFSSEDIQGRWAIDMVFENHSLDRVMENSPHDVYPTRNLFGVFSNGFYFYGDSCNYKPGFFDRNNSDNGIPMLIGSKTKFKINGDTLKVWDIANLDWQMLLIKGLDEKSLMLQTIGIKDEVFKYKKVEKVSNSIRSFDKVIVVSITPEDLSDELYTLDNDGNYLYQKFEIREIDEIPGSFYQSKLKVNLLESIIDGFDFIDLDSLQEEYLSAKMGGNTTNFVFFIKNGEISKVIEDHDNVSPDELQWGYNAVIFLRRQLDMKFVESYKDIYGSEEIELLHPRIFKEVKERLGWHWDYIEANKKVLNKTPTN
ncbi:hypothetical protein VJ786_05530 [Sphingobacterium sp. PU5-4]|uniref:Lipocalin-like domain-containing protein n=1 Tax=Sphingobacterium tenebrionis TaxID=3111775 RepID=A0ABU8I3S4_9SPHI